MSTLPLNYATPPQGSLVKALAWIGQAWAARREAAAFAGMSEREFADVGWGQADRYSHAAHLPETPPERKARAVAVAAWHAPVKKAA